MEAYLEVLYYKQRLSTTKQVDLINEKEFVKMALDKNSKTFVIYVVFFNLNSNSIYLDKEI